MEIPKWGFLTWFLGGIQLITVVMLLWTIGILQPRIGPFTLTDSQENSRQVKLPFQDVEIQHGSYVFSGTVWSRQDSHLVLNIIPDDCVTSVQANSRTVPLDSFSRQDLCSYSRGFTLDLSPYLEQSQVDLVITVNNSGSGRFALTVQAAKLIFLRYHVVLFLMLGLILCIQLCTLAKLAWAETLILCAAMGVRLWYLQYTPFDTRTYDVLEGGGHLDYIRHLMVTMTLPPPHSGWEYHQPPLYYLIAAVVLKISSLFWSDGTYLILQVLSLAIFSIFLVNSASLFRFVFASRPITWTLLILLCFWPSGIIHSIRIGNDILLYALSAGALYHTVRWWCAPSSQQFLLSVFFCACALLTKTNSLSLAATLVVLSMLHAGYLEKGYGRARRTLICGLVFSSAILINLGDNIYYSLENKKADWLLGDVTQTINRGLFVNRSLPNFYRVDFVNLLTVPFTSTWDDSGGRQFFWNFLIKTALFGEFNFKSPLHWWLAIVLVWIFVALLVCMLSGFIIAWRAKKRGLLPLLLYLICNLALLTSYCIKVPSASNGDFRYIFPVLLPLCLGLGWHLEWVWKRNWPVLRFNGYALAGIFALTSLCFFALLPTTSF